LHPGEKHANSGCREGWVQSWLVRAMARLGNAHEHEGGSRCTLAQGAARRGTGAARLFGLRRGGRPRPAGWRIRASSSPYSTRSAERVPI
jgi:hypothetical protein